MASAAATWRGLGFRCGAARQIRGLRRLGTARSSRALLGVLGRLCTLATLPLATQPLLLGTLGQGRLCLLLRLLLFLSSACMVLLLPAGVGLLLVTMSR